MPQKRPTAKNPQSIQESALFLLPFTEVATCRLTSPVKTEKTQVEKKGKHSKGLNCESCIFTRKTPEKELISGDSVANKFTSFSLLLNQFVLLRPFDSDSRPGVGKILSFKCKEKGGENEAYVQWFYRGEDLVDCPKVAVGDDEVFETMHFDSIDVESICGRCSVTSYDHWVQIHCEKRGSVPAKALEELCAYDNSAVHLHCRRFYDSGTQSFFDSKYECTRANPLNELADLRDALQLEDVDMDVEYNDGDESDDISSSDADDDTAFDPLEIDGLADRQSKRARRDKTRPGTSRKKTARGSRARIGRISAAQFALPQELGTIEILPCRDGQKAHVREFILSCVGDNGLDEGASSTCLYISGVPGTGKTATVREVVRGLRQRMACGDLPKFQVVELNAMSLADPNLVYSELYTAITGQSGVAPMHAAQLLEQRFCDLRDATQASGKKKGNRMMDSKGRENTGYIIVVLDEMDVLLARKQKVLYDMLEWPTRKNARLAIIGIANTMDLPERMLPRLGSRLGLNRLVYPPYTSDQILTILNMTVDQTEFKFDALALMLCAKKIGAVSGDVRRALELCRRATEQTRERLQKGPDEKRNEIKEVTAKDVKAAMQEMAGNFRNVALQQLSLFERLALASAIDLARRQGSFDVDSTCSMEAVCETANDFATRNDAFFKVVGKPSSFDIEEACWRLAGQRMLVIEKAMVQRRSRVIVNVSVDDCTFALAECQLCSKILKEP